MPAAVDELTSSCVGHWFAMSYEPGSGGMFGSPSTGSLKPPYSGRHAAFTPPAPGAPHDTTLYVPAEAGGTHASIAAHATTIPATPRIPARIARECTPLEGS